MVWRRAWRSPVSRSSALTMVCSHGGPGGYPEHVASSRSRAGVSLGPQPLWRFSAEVRFQMEADLGVVPTYPYQ